MFPSLSIVVILLGLGMMVNCSGGEDGGEECGNILTSTFFRQCLTEFPHSAAKFYEAGCNMDCICNHGSPIGGTCHWERRYCRCKYPKGTDFQNVTNAACIFGETSKVMEAIKELHLQAEEITKEYLAQGDAK